MDFTIDDTHIAWLVMGYLKEKRCFEALSSFQLECGLCDTEASDEVKYIQKLTLQGRWDDLLKYLQPIRSILLQSFDKILLPIYKQKYLEALSWQGGGGHRHALLPWKSSKSKPSSSSSSKQQQQKDQNEEDEDFDSEEILILLKSLERLASKQEFNSLCECLTLEKLGDHETYGKWSVSEGRIETFTILRESLRKILPGDVLDVRSSKTMLSQQQHYHSKGLYGMISMALAQQSSIRSGSFSVTWNRDLQMPMVDCITDPTTLSIPKLIIRNSISNILYEDDSEEVISQRHNEEFEKIHEFSEVKEEEFTQQLKRKPSLPSTSKVSSKVDDEPAPLIPRAPISWTVEIPPSSSSNNISNTSTVTENTSQHTLPTPPTLPSTRPRSNPRAKTPTLNSTTELKQVPTTIPHEPTRYQQQSQSQSQPQPSPIPPSKQFTSRDSIDEVSVASKMSMDSRQVQPSNSKPSQIPVSKPIQLSNHSTSSQIEPVTNKTMHTVEQIFPSDWKGTEIFESSCPLRCISILEEHHEKTPRVYDSIDIAVGSNAKSVHQLRTEISDTTGISYHQLGDHIDVHKGSIYAMDNCPKLGLLATGSNDKTIRIYNSKDETWTTPLRNHNGTVRTLKFCPSEFENHNYFVSAGAGDYRPRLWDVTTGNCVSVLNAHEAVIHALLWVDSNTILSGCEAGVVIAHDIRSNAIIWQHRLLQGKDVAREHQGICTLEHFSGSIGVAGCNGGVVALFDTKSGLLIHHERIHSDDIRAVATIQTSISQLPPMLVTTSFDGTGGIWKLSNLLHPKKEFKNISLLSGVHTDKLLSVVVSQKLSETLIFTSGADGRVVVWNPSK